MLVERIDVLNRLHPGSVKIEGNVLCGSPLRCLVGEREGDAGPLPLSDAEDCELDLMPFIFSPAISR